jgi:hypothetical protein
MVRTPAGSCSIVGVHAIAAFKVPERVKRSGQQPCAAVASTMRWATG